MKDILILGMSRKELMEFPLMAIFHQYLSKKFFGKIKTYYKFNFLGTKWLFFKQK